MQRRIPAASKYSASKGAQHKQPMKMHKIIFVTSNRHKFLEVKAVLKRFGIGLVRRKFNFVENDSTSLRAEAANKARQAYAKFKKPLIVEDTGFFFRAYKGFPGMQSRRIFEAIGYDGLFRLLRGKSREAYSAVAVCYISGPNKIHTFTGKMHGTITTKVIRPNSDVMPYEKIFRILGEKRTLSEMSREEKNAISHRAIAARKLARFLVTHKK